MLFRSLTINGIPARIARSAYGHGSLLLLLSILLPLPVVELWLVWHSVSFIGFLFISLEFLSLHSSQILLTEVPLLFFICLLFICCINRYASAHCPYLPLSLFLSAFHKQKYSNHFNKIDDDTQHSHIAI